MSGQSPRVADVAPAFVGGHLPSDGEQVGRELLTTRAGGAVDGSITAPPGSGWWLGHGTTSENYSAPRCLCCSSR